MGKEYPKRNQNPHLQYNNLGCDYLRTEIWHLKSRIDSKLLAIEMDFWKLAARISKFKISRCKYNFDCSL